MLFLILIELKHFVADYYLQTSAMYSSRRAAADWLFPLLRHAGTNGAGAAVVALIVTGNPVTAILAGLTDTVCHAIIDRCKIYTEPALGTRPAMVLDQMLHQATYLLIYCLFI